MKIWQKDILEKIVEESYSQKEVLNKLGIRVAGGNYNTLRKYLNIWNISTEHFTKCYDKMLIKNLLNKKDISEYLKENSSCSRTNLKRRLLEEGFLENKCCLCGQDEYWNGMKISLILDHINGIHNDNRIENLRIVCPNCNAGLNTFAGKNNKRDVKNIIIENDRKIIEYNGTNIKRKICKCGVEISKKSKSCVVCFNTKRRSSDKNNLCGCGKSKHKTSETCNKCRAIINRKIVNRPPIEILLKDIEELGYSATGRKYGVSDNSIRKWIKIEV